MFTVDVKSGKAFAQGINGIHPKRFRQYHRRGGISLYAALTLDVFDDLINRLVGAALELALVEEEAELAAHARRVATRTLKILGIGELASTIASRCSLIAHGIDARRILKTDLIEARVVKVLDLNLDRRALGLAFCGMDASRTYSR